MTRRLLRRSPPALLLAASVMVAVQPIEAASRAAERARRIEPVSGRTMRIDESRPLVAVFDVHGTLVESTWRDSYARAYEILNGHVDHVAAIRWVNAHLIGIPESQVVERLAVAMGMPRDRAQNELDIAKDHYRYRHVAKAVAGALEFVRALHEKDVPIIIQSDGDRNVIIRQLKEAGFFPYLDERNILGRDDMAAAAPDGLFSEKARDSALVKLSLKYPRRDFVHFNDSFTGFEGVRLLDGINVGIAAGSGVEFRHNRAELIGHGVDFIIGGFSDVWRRLLEELRL